LLLQKKSGTFVLIDIREPAEYAEGHIRGSINIPLMEFSKVSAQVPMGKKIVITCSTGARIYNAYRQLRRMGHIDISQAILDEWEEAGLKLVSGSSSR
jgi:rhodanese-related sulfurtransferase